MLKASLWLCCSAYCSSVVAGCLQFVLLQPSQDQGPKHQPCGQGDQGNGNAGVLFCAGSTASRASRHDHKDSVGEAGPRCPCGNQDRESAL